MKQSLRSKLTISFLAVAVLCVALISIFSNLYLERQFRRYVKNNQEEKNLELVMHIAHQYEIDQGFEIDSLEDIGSGALENGLIVRVGDNQGNILWDALQYDHDKCQSKLDDIHDSMLSRYPNWKGEFTSSEYPIIVNSEKVGTVYIGYYGPFYFNDNDLAFINNLNIVFIAVGALALILAIVLGNMIARGISRPIRNVISTAQGISMGSFDNKPEVRSSVIEIDSLTKTIYNLADILKHQELLRKRLTADVAHELRTPLSTLQSHLEAMIDGIWEADTERLKSCHDEIIRISRMVGDLESLAKYEGENLVLNKTEFDIVELIRSIAMNFEKEMLDKSISFSVPKIQVMLYADRDKMSQVMINLLSNAVKYTKKGGSVVLDAAAAAGEVIIRVKDTGIGIEKEHLKNIFERFYRADSSRSRLTGGSGIGLTITKAIVEAHGGTIEVQSEVNAGTELTIILPQNQ